MGKTIDRVFGYGLGFIVGFLYFRLTLQTPWVAVVCSAVVCLLAAYMVICLAGKRGKKATNPKKRFSLQGIVSRERAPRCALYGALYMALYLLLGTIVYLPLSLVLLFLAGMGYKQPSPAPVP